jgi:hypothetical protein
VTAVVFAAFHIAADPWLYLWYFVFAISTGLITWRSGGIEISIVIHAAFNTLGFIFAVGLSTDLSAAIDRSAGDETTALGLVGPSLILLATTIVVWFGPGTPVRSRLHLWTGATTTGNA